MRQPGPRWAEKRREMDAETAPTEAMTDQSGNDAYHNTSFLQGGNAQYIEQMYARYAANPGTVDEGWRAFFAGLGDDTGSVRDEAAGAPWARADWPPAAKGDLISALDGQWPEVPDSRKAAE